MAGSAEPDGAPTPTLGALQQVGRLMSRSSGGQQPQALATGGWSSGAHAAAATEAAVKLAATARYDYCAANVHEILAERTAKGGEVELLVSWLGRSVADTWVPRSLMEDDVVSRGLLMEYEDNKAWEVARSPGGNEELGQEGEPEPEPEPEREREREQEDDDDAFSVDGEDGWEELEIGSASESAASSTTAAVARVTAAFEAGEVAFSLGSGSSIADLGSDEDFELVEDADEPTEQEETDVAQTTQSSTVEGSRTRRRGRRRRSRRGRRRAGGDEEAPVDYRRVPVEKVQQEDLPPDLRQHWRAFQAGYLRRGLPFERVARQLAGPAGRAKGSAAASVVTVGGVARILCRLGLVGARKYGAGAGPRPWRSIPATLRQQARTEATEMLYEVAELGLCQEALSGKVEERQVTLSSLSLALLYFRVVHNKNGLEPRRLFTIVEFLLFAHPDQRVGETFVIRASDAFLLLSARFGRVISAIPRRMYEQVEVRERSGGCFSFAEWLNSACPLLPPQWSVI